MTDGEAIRLAVLADPDDDLPRLVFADWLDENGRAERAAFIRTQIEAARAEPYSPDARAAALRADRLLKLNYHDWTDHLFGRVEEPRFERGFVSHVAVAAERFPEVADTLFKMQPVRSVRVKRDPNPLGHGSLEPFFDAAALNRLTALELPGVHLLHFEWEALLNCPHLAGLTALSLAGNPLQPQWLTPLLAGPHFPQLTALDLSDNSHIGPGFAAAVDRAPNRRFTRLNLSGVSFKSGELGRTLANPALGGVEELRLGWGGGPDNPGPLTHLDLSWVLPWQRLRLLDLAGQGLGPQGVLELVRQPEAANLRWLGLAANRLGRSGANILAGPSNLRLYELDVRGNELKPADLDALRERFPEAVVVG